MFVPRGGRLLCRLVGVLPQQLHAPIVIVVDSTAGRTGDDAAAGAIRRRVLVRFVFVGRGVAAVLERLLGGVQLLAQGVRLHRGDGCRVGRRTARRCRCCCWWCRVERKKSWISPGAWVSRQQNKRGDQKKERRKTCRESTIV